VSKVLPVGSLNLLIVQDFLAVGVQAILPVGDELSKEELLNIAGEMFDMDSGSGRSGVPWISVSLGLFSGFVVRLRGLRTS
jgi:hypothetical protein